jgi:hypothetical protein
MHIYTLGEEDARIPPSNRLQAKETFIVYMPNQEADLVHMSSDHHAGTAIPTLQSYDVAHGVELHLVCHGLKLIGN